MEESDVSVVGVEVSAVVEERVRRVPMPLGEFLVHEWPEWERAEWTNGVAVVSPIARKRHQIVAKRLVRLIDDSLTGAEAYQEIGVELESARRIPDVFVEVDGAAGDEVWSTVMPVLVAEVISPSSRAEDRVRKYNEYAAAGIAFYLLVDHVEQTLIALRNDGGTWEPVLELDDRTPTGELDVGEYGVVRFDLTALFTF
jgi:Uma2 family endonuclease